MSVAGGHEFIFECFDCFLIEVLFGVLDAIDQLVGVFGDFSRDKASVIVIEASFLFVFVEIVSVKNHRS